MSHINTIAVTDSKLLGTRVYAVLLISAALNS